ncbi:hypothetical protein QIS74_08765 [Colletotrichum tabaci]|uniref:C2H2-type domain-containing protein n=1 Tax=Colletotrichum tabaci TaxID=1209068 RepID=A0AAV9T8P4_9PEZI
MGFILKDPPPDDRWDCHYCDGDPGQHRLDEIMDFADRGTVISDDGHLSASPWATPTTTPMRRQPCYPALGQPRCLASTSSTELVPTQSCDPTCAMQSAFSVDGTPIASVQSPDLVLAIVEHFVPNVPLTPLHLGQLQETLSDFRMAFLGEPETCCLELPTPRRSGSLDGSMMTFSIAQLLPQHPILTTASRLAKDLTQQVAESTTIYDHHYDPFYQQPSTSETESTYMSAATFNVGRSSNDDTITHFSGANPLLDAMAVTTTGWSYGAQPVSAAPDAMDDNMFQHSPLSDFLEMSDESDDWAILMQQDMLVTGAFEMAGFDFSTTMMEETNYQTPDSPEDIFNDPTVQYDIEQSLQTTGLFDFNGLLPDLSASGYLSGTDQVSSYFGSTNTSPYEPALDFFPEAAPSPSSIFPASADGSPLGTTTTTTTSPDSDSAAAHPYHCTTDGCPKTFRKEAQLKQHQRVHRKALVCDICRSERRTEHKFAQVRDLERHLQARHRDVAERANVRSEVRQCPHPGCEHEGRRDNVSRHHRSKHGKELKWKRGVPHVVG